MSTLEFTLSHLLRNSGEVLDAVEHTDVVVARRDGSDLLVGTLRRETAVRDGLDLAARALAAVLANPALGEQALESIENALPWIGWLDSAERADFVHAFVRTSSACHDTDNYEPLARLLHQWRVSAQIMHTPELTALLVDERGTDERIVLERPRD